MNSARWVARVRLERWCVKSALLAPTPLSRVGRSVLHALQEPSCLRLTRQPVLLAQQATFRTLARLCARLVRLASLLDQTSQSVRCARWASSRPAVRRRAPRALLARLIWTLRWPRALPAPLVRIVATCLLFTASCAPLALLPRAPAPPRVRVAAADPAWALSPELWVTMDQVLWKGQVHWSIVPGATGHLSLWPVERVRGWVLIRTVSRARKGRSATGWTLRR